jgi:hypothetical protein
MDTINIVFGCYNVFVAKTGRPEADTVKLMYRIPRAQAEYLRQNGGGDHLRRIIALHMGSVTFTLTVDPHTFVSLPTADSHT